MYQLRNSDGRPVGDTNFLVEVSVGPDGHIVVLFLELTGVTFLEPEFNFVSIDPIPETELSVAVAIKGDLVVASRLNLAKYIPMDRAHASLEAHAVRAVHDWAKKTIAEAPTVPPAPVRFNWDE